MVLKPLFYGISLALISYSCRTQKIEPCENENFFNSITSTPCLHIDSLFDDLNSSHSSKSVNKLVHEKLKLNSPLSGYSFYLIDSDSSKYLANFENTRIPGFYAYTRHSVDIRKNDLFLNNKKTHWGDLKTTLESSLQKDTLFSSYIINFNWHKGANRDLISNSLHSLYTCLNQIRETDAIKKFNKGFCDLDSTQVLSLHTSKYLISFRYLPAPFPPEISTPQFELAGLCNTPSNNDFILTASDLISDIFLSSTEIICPDSTARLKIPFNMTDGEETFKCLFQHDYIAYCGPTNKIDVLINFKNDLFLEDKKINPDSLQSCLLKQIESQQNDGKLVFGLNWDKPASKETILNTMRTYQRVINHYMNQKSLQLFSTVISELDSSQFELLQPKDFCFTFESNYSLDSNYKDLIIELDSTILSF